MGVNYKVNSRDIMPIFFSVFDEHRCRAITQLTWVDLFNSTILIHFGNIRIFSGFESKLKIYSKFKL